MDPPSMINEAHSFPSANGSSSYNLAEIWQFPLTGTHFGANSGGFGDTRTGNRDILVDESTLTDQSGRSGAGSRKRRDVTVSDDESSKLVSTSGGNEMNDNDVKRLKVSESRDDNGESKPEVGASSGDVNKPTEQSSQPSEPPKQDYIHVRARRGQATDSHSLAERARREKISERMKILQDLVPGCNKVIGKAMVLDEIINYIQSLQHQVEFLSMKLEAVNSRLNPSIDGFPSKDFGAQAFDNSGMALQAVREYGQGSPQEWLHMQVGGSFERAP